ncbi:MAG: bis(5'-nucleosyl)-tetraphosphatase (symmetrical) YqeK [Lachnospiraceae bacterium]|nr:bis(5'-nucleosyl)-tetraphosphatase (symmetrical) YqeK [Lachnospiraceae bacterium]
MTYKQIQKELKQLLKPSRYGHTLGVVETARHLAEIYDCDANKARYAALLHDCAKYMSNEEKIDLCRKYDVPINDAELANPSLLHAKCGAILAKYHYGIEDEDILHAIAVHTTGEPDMNLLDKIIFVSDYIEPGRETAPNLYTLRQLAKTDLDETTYRILSDTVSYLNNRRDQCMDPTTLKAYQYYKDKVKDISN